MRSLESQSWSGFLCFAGVWVGRRRKLHWVGSVLVCERGCASSLMIHKGCYSVTPKVNVDWVPLSADWGGGALIRSKCYLWVRKEFLKPQKWMLSISFQVGLCVPPSAKYKLLLDGASFKNVGSSGRKRCVLPGWISAGDTTSLLSEGLCCVLSPRTHMMCTFWFGINYVPSVPAQLVCLGVKHFLSWNTGNWMASALSRQLCI